MFFLEQQAYKKKPFFKKNRYPQRERTVQNYYWKNRKGRKLFNIFWRAYRYKVHLKPFTAQKRRLTLYRTYTQRWNRYPYKYRTLTSVSGMPKYINYKQLFYNQMLEKQTFRKFFRLRHYQLVNHFRKAIKSSKRMFDTCFLKHFEFRLDIIAYRANFTYTFLQARREVKKGFFMVNGQVITKFSKHVTIGDVVTPHLFFVNSLSYMLIRSFLHPLQTDQYPHYMIINERVPAALIFDNPNADRLKYSIPISWQFIIFSMLKYK
jgi:ribosomal protein S4